MRTIYIPTIVILMLSLLIFLFQPTSNQWLAYYHSGIENGQWWRLITAHLSHTNGFHLLLNAAGLVVINSLFIKSFNTINLIFVSIFSSIFISLCLFWLDPNMQWYMGLSGVLHALFAVGVCDEISKKDKWGWILGIGLISKLTSEQINGSSPGIENLIAATVAVDAHLYGAIAGILYFLLKQLSTSLRHYFK